jgi:CRISPR-associated protein Cas2
MIEVDTGVFVGRLSAMVRDLLWQKCVEHARDGRCCLVYPADNEQGFAMRIAGYTDREIRDWDGLLLVTFRNAKALRHLGQVRPSSGDDFPLDSL